MREQKARKPTRPVRTPHGPVTDVPARGLETTQRVTAQRARFGTLFGPTLQRQEADGLPDGLRQRVEALSGVQLGGVTVRRNSAEPGRIGASAFARDPEIHLASGAEHHLPHEAWHIAQQRQGRVAPTGRIAGTSLNDEPALEAEADRMAVAALASPPHDAEAENAAAPRQNLARGPAPLQPKWIDEKRGYLRWDKLIDGLRWYYDVSTGRMFYVVERTNKDALPMAGPENARPRADWVRMHGGDPLKDEDASVTPAKGHPGVVELGAGEGRFSGPFRGKLAEGRPYLATDIAEEEGPTKFLSIAKEQGIAHLFGVNANELDRRFGPRSVAKLVAANPYGGGKDMPGASFGLMRYVTKGSGAMEPDPRFLQSASKVLAPGGTVDIYGRTNTLRNAKREPPPKPGPAKGEKKKKLPKTERQKLAALAKQKRDAVDRKYPQTNENPHLNIKPEQLEELAKATGFRVRVKRAKQPEGVQAGGDPDTKLRVEADEIRKEGLQDFTTRFTFTNDPGYESDEEHPRVDYDSDEESEWDEKASAEPGPWAAGESEAPPERGAEDAAAIDLPGRIFGQMAAEIETHIDGLERNGTLSRREADQWRNRFRPRVEELIMGAIKQIEHDPRQAQRVIRDGIFQMEQLQSEFGL